MTAAIEDAEGEAGRGFEILHLCGGQLDTMGRLFASRLTTQFTWRSLLARQGVTRAEMDAFRDARLREIVRHAWEQVPYYRRMFEQQGVRASDIRCVADLSALPILSKKDLQALPAADITARGLDPDGLIPHLTSGSTGRTVTIRRTWFEERWLNAFRRRAERTFGQRPMDRLVCVGLDRPLDPRNDRLPQRILRGPGLQGMSILDCRQPVRTLVRQLCELQPDVLSGFAAVVWRIAMVATDAERKLIRPRFVHTGGEVLTSPMRRRIAEALDAPVYDVYGSHEFNIIAWECTQTGDYHTCDDLLLVEVLHNGRPVAPGQRGEVVATSLHSFAMPIIRFRLGDRVTKGEAQCACGQPFSTIRAIEGRMTDHFPLPDGRVVHPYELVTLILANAPWIQEYRLVQEQADLVVLHVVALAGPSPEELALVCGLVSRQLGPTVRFEVALESEIPIDPSGKTRVFRSLVESNYDSLNWSASR